jgi:hypothetical protein
LLCVYMVFLFVYFRAPLVCMFPLVECMSFWYGHSVWLFLLVYLSRGVSAGICCIVPTHFMSDIFPRYLNVCRYDIHRICYCSVYMPCV